MSAGQVLALLLLSSLAATTNLTNTEEEEDQGPTEDAPEYKCLHCDITTDIMCYNNQSCNADVTGHQYCYFRLIQVFNANKTKWDWDYFTNYREWGCTTDLETCERTCSETEGCNRNQSVCCNAQLYQLNGNYSQENHAAYSRCYYGSGSRVDVVMNCQFLVLSILILDWLVR
ncbi:uncharacterized protein LOC134815082 [Bolinopsis microptera]|uniref:uncharacterized protein LOC134815082 n=1 Tax=Bolinopsis microptera TaxID=2820187 RepID=UPI003079CC72